MSRLILCFALLFPTAVRAQDTSHISRDAYVTGNAMATLLHEIGHAFVDRFKIPILGGEEGAVDTFATLELLEIQALYGVDTDVPFDQWWDATLDAWVRGAVERGELAFEDMQGAHPLDEQRLFDQLCLLFGADEEAFGPAAAGYGLDPEYAQDCEAVYITAFNNWLTVLSNADALERDSGGEGRDLRFQFDAPQDPEFEEFREMFEGSVALELLQTYLSQTYKLDPPQIIRFYECGEENAFYDPASGQVEMCYEELAAYARHWRAGQP